MKLPLQAEDALSQLYQAARETQNRYPSDNAACPCRKSFHLKQDKEKDNGSKADPKAVLKRIKFKLSANRRQYNEQHN